MRGARRWLAVLAVAGVLASAASVPLSTAHAADTPLTASFAGVPSAHDGVSPFSFDLVFSEPASIGYATLRDDSFTVTGATVTGARRVDGRSDRWKITVAPDVPTATDAVGDISIELAATSDCGDEGAVCTAGDAKALSNTTTATVAAPPPLTAELEEVPATHDTSAAFSFRLRFDTAVTTSYRILGDTAFDVTGGSVTGARRVDGRSDLWQITIQPDAVDDDTVDDDITITLPATTDCGDADAVCTVALRPLSEPVTAAVEGPLVEAEPNTGGRRVTRGIPGDKEDEEEDRVGVRALPGRPGSLEIQGGNEQVTVSWTAVTSDPAVTAYVLEYRVGDSGPYTMVSRGDVLALSETITGRTNYERFRVQVYAENDEGTSGTRGTTAMAVPTVPLASANAHATDISGDGTTLWVADTADNKSYAYTKATGARNSSLDFDYNTAHVHAAGQCLLDGFFWIADSDDDHIYAYNKDTRAHDTTKSFDLHDDNANARGVACRDGTIWVADSIDKKMYAYGTDGARDPDSDITLDSSAGVGNGAWTDGTTMWISDTGGRLRAYDVAASTDLTTDYGIASTTVAGLSSPSGVWSDSTDLWITDIVDNLFYKFELPQRTAAAAPSVPQNLSFVSSNESLVLDWDAVTSDPEVTNYVVQYRVEDAAAWIPWTRTSSATDTEETIDGLTNYTVYEVQVAARNGDTDEAIGDYATIDRAMPSVNHDAVLGTGLWSDGTTYWVLRSSQGEAKAYTLASGARQSGKDVEFQDANSEQSAAEGICSDGTTTWVSGESLNKIYAYEHALDDGMLAYTSDKDIDTGSGSTPAGLWCDEDTLLVVANNGHEVRVYDLPSRDTDSARNIDGLTNAFGVWSDGVTIWVSQGNTGSTAINAYSALDGARREWLDIKNLDAAAATNLRGIWSDDNHMWVGHIIPHSVFKFPLPQYGDGPPVPRSAEVSAGGTTVKVTFTEALATGVTPAVERFEVTVGSGTVTLDSVAHTSGDATSVTLTLPDAAGEGVAVTVAYNDPDNDQTDNVVQDAGGADAPSFTKLSATPRAVTAPGAPTGLMAAPGNASLTVTWTAPTTSGAPASYAVRYRLTSADADMDSSYTTVTRGDDALETEETITGLTNGTGYTVQVNATNTAGTSAWAAVTGTPTATDSTLISNFDQESDTHYNQKADLAQRFSTGTNDFGYSLSSIEIGSEDPQGDPFSLSVCTVDSNGFPTNTCTPFTPPADFTLRTIEFTAPAGTVLAADTTYTVLLDPVEFVRFDATTSDAEDTGGGSGWSIANQLDTYSAVLSVWVEESSGISIRIAVKGNILTTDTNTAPRASDGSVTAIENTAHIFTADDFNFVDTDADDALEKVKIVTLPRAGTLELDDTTVTENQEIAKAAIDAGNLVFTPATDATGDEYATFTFKVNDGDNESASAYTMTVNVRDPGSTLISNFGQGSNNNVNTNVTAQRFTTGSSADGYELNSVEVISQDIQGDSFSLSVCTVDGDGFPTDPCTPLAPPSSFAAGTRVFVTPTDMILAADTTYTVLLSVLVPGTFVSYKATDSDNEDTGGYDGWSIADSRDLKTTMWFEANGVSIRINVKGNAVPTASDGSVTTAENTAYAFAAEDFNFVDVDDGDELEKVKIVTLPTDGALELDDAPVAVNQEIAKADIDAGNLVFTPATDGTGDEYATFMFRVNDGKSEGTTAYTMAVEVRETGSTLISNFDQGDGVIFHNLAAALGFTTGPSADGYVLNSVEVESEDIQGDSFSLSVCAANTNGLPTDPCTELTEPSSFAKGILVFVTPTDMTLAADTRYAVVLVSDSATFVNWAATNSDDEDTGGVAGWSIGDDFAVRNSPNVWTPSDTGRSFRINVKGNAIPTASHGSVTTDENTAYIFAADDFNFVDANTADALERVKIVTLPADGRLALAGTAVAVNQEITKADIDAGELVFTPVTDGNGEPYATFTFKVNDGEIEGTSTYTMTVNVTAFIRTPSAPTGVHVSGTLGSVTSVDVGWTVPEHINKPAITGYKLQYRESGETDWINGPQAATGTSSTIASLGEDTTYQVQVLAFNDAGDGTWSSAATGHTNARQSPYNLISNLTLGGSGYIEFQGFRWSQGFTTGPGSNGYKLETVTLRIGKPDSSTRGIRVRLYTDDNGVPDDKIFTFTNPSTIPSGENDNDLVFAAPSGTRLDRDTKYHVELAQTGGSGPHLRFYRTSRNDQSGETGFDLNNASKYWNGAEWLDHVQQRAGYLGVRGATIANDMPYITEVEVEDAPGDGSGYETDDEITVSVTFSEAVDVIGYPRFPLRLNTGFEQAVYSRSDDSNTVLEFDYTVAADHHDGNGFEIWSNRFNRAGGAIKRAGSTVDADLDKPYRSTGPDYTINATSVPTGVHVSGTVGSTTSVDVGWTAPDNTTGRPAITGYKLQYRESGETDWINGPQNATGTSTTIASLTANTAYEVQVLAFNSESDGAWSATATGRTNAQQTETALVSNFSYSGTQANILFEGTRWSQGFDTGTNSSGYKLENVELKINRGSNSTRGIRVRLYTNDNGEPDNKIFTFTNPSTIPTGLNDLVFTAPSGTRLAPSTKYHVVFERYGGSGNDIRYRATSENGQTGISGFEIDDAVRFFNNFDWINQTNSYTAYLRVTGATIANDTPYITDVEIEDAPGDGFGYETGDEITVSVTFSEAVDVIGEPRFPLRFNTGSKQAVYSRSRESDTVLDFDYTVAADDHDSDGFVIWSNLFDRAGGAIKRAGSTVDADLDKPFRSPGSDYTINATSATEIGMESGPSLGEFYTVDDHVEFKVTFSGAVDVTGTPQFAFCMNNSGQDCNETQADYNRGSGTTELIFRYEVQAADSDTNGVFIEDKPLTLNSGTITKQGDSTRNANLVIDGPGTQGGHKVYGGPLVSSVAVTSQPRYSDDTYTLGEDIEITVTFTEAVDVEGDPVFRFNLANSGGNTGVDVGADYESGSGTDALMFAYEVQAEDNDSNGLWIGYQDRTFNLDDDDSIEKTSSDVDALLTHDRPGTQSDHKVKTSDNPPKFPSTETRERSVAENSPAGTAVGAPFTATDPDSGAMLVFSLGGDDAASFTIGSSSGQISTKPGVTYDYEDKITYSLTVSVNDGTYTDTIDVTITLTDIANETDCAAPTYTAPTYTGDLTQIWTGELTVGSFEASSVRFYGYNSTTDPDTGALSDTTVTVTTDHTVESVSVGSGTQAALLAFKFTDSTKPALSVVRKLMLYACDKGFAMGGFVPGGNGSYTLANSRLDWSSETPLNLYIAIDDDGPELQTAEVADSTLVLTFNEYLDEDARVPVSAFAVTVAGTAAQPSSVAVDRATVTLMLATPVTEGQTVTLTYTKQAGTPRVRDVFTNEAAALTDQAVVNNTAATPSAPTGVHVSGTLGSTTSVDVGWTAPVNTDKPAITGYKLQYRESGETDWIDGPQDATGTSSVIASLTANTVHEVQVRAFNSEGDGTWSSIASGRTNAVQSATTLVSNFSEENPFEANFEDFRWSQGFTTGSQSNGYELQNVALKIIRPSGSTRGITVRLYTDDNEDPGDSLFTFTNPSTMPSGPNDIVFTAPSGTRLDPATKYHVVFQRSGGSGADLKYRVTSSNSQDGETGFALADSEQYFNGSVWVNHAQMNAVYLRVRGAIATDMPYVTDVEVEDAPADSLGYETGDEITVSVTFSEAVDVIGNPRFPLQLNTESKQAVYSQSRESDTVLDFNYTVAADDHDSNGFEILSDLFDRNGGAIKRAGSTVDADLDKPFRSPGSDYTINATSATDIEMESAPSLGEFYTVGDHVEFKVTFSGAVDVTGTPQFAFCMNNSGQDCNETQADYNRGSGTNELIFRYEVQAADSDTNGVFIEDKPLTLNSGTITTQGDSTRSANLALDGPGTQSGHKVYGGPLVSSVAVTSQPRYSDDTYTLGEDIEITVTFSEAVDVEGDPVFRFNLMSSGGNDDVNVDADYDRGSGTDTLVFAYEVQAEDNDSNGLWIGDQGRTFDLDSDDSIERTSSDVDALLTHSGLGTQENHKVKTSDNPPKFPSTETGGRSVAENSPAGTAVGAPFTATDADSDTLVFSLDDASSFTIDSSSGQISTITGVTYDYEVKITYSLTVSVTDGTYTDTIDVTITLTDIDETDATLSALTLMHGSTSVSLSPTFASGTTDYRAWVADDVSSVTVTATKNDDEASVAITGDSDTNTPNTAVQSLAEGANTVTVTVTARDNLTTGTYEITAVREASAPTADPTALMTAKMTVAQDGTNDIYGYRRAGSNYGALTGNEFDFDGTTYTITNLFWNGPDGENSWGLERLILCFNSLPSNSVYNNWTLRIGSVDYSLDGRDRFGTSRCVRWDRTDAWAYGEVVTVKMFGNQAATGAPVVSGTAQVGQTLTLSKSGIADLDGRTNADGDESGFAYEYQWIRVDGSDETDISGATSGTYVPVAGDVGKKVKVEVSFTDDRSNEEELTSAAYPATGTIVVADSRPDAPTGVTVGAGNRSLVVGWSAVTATPVVTGYKIQYRPAGSSDAWTAWTGTIAASATSETVTGLTEWVSYDVQVLAVNSEGDGAWSDSVAGTAHRDVTLSAAGSVDGVASDGTTLWATVPGSNIASAYTLSNGTADTAKNITFASGTAPTGICAHGTRVWVAQSNSTTLQAYDNTDDTRQSAKDVTLPTGTNPVALWCSADFLFVAHDDTSGSGDAVLSYKDDLDGSYDRIMDKDVEGLEAAGNANPAGLSIDGDILWVSDSVDNKAYAYSTTTGRRLADMDLDLGSAVGTAAGIWGDAATLWAADADAAATEIDSSRRPQATDGDPDVWHATMENDSSTKMRVEFSEVLDDTSTPPASAFTVMAGTDPVAVSSVVHLDTGGGTILKTLVLTLGSDVPAGTTVTVSYTDPNPGSNDATGVVQDLDGNDAPSFSGLRVWSLPGGLPGGVSVVPGDGELEVSWDAAADTGRRPAGTSYQVQYKRSTATGWTTVARSNDDRFVVGQTITGPTNGLQHDVRVRAENNVGDGPYSAVVRATPSAGPLVEVDAGSADNTFKATDNKSGPTTWHYAWIAGTAVCDSTTTFPDMSNYTEGDNLTYTSTQNTNKACFRSTEGTNSGYAASEVVNTNAASSDATLSALTLVEGSNSVTLTPTFASGTTAYRAWVANGVSSVTVTATKNESGASVAITGDSGTSTPGSTAVLLLAEGANTVTVTVTAADTTTTGTYTITAVREASAPTADPTALLTAKMTAGQPGTVGAYGYQSDGANYGALTGNAFEFNGTTYTITNLYWNGPQGQNVLLLDNLYLCFDSLPSNSDDDLWTLRVGSDDYRLADGLPVGTTDCVRWDRTDAWAYGDVVTVKMFGNQAATGAPVVSGTAQVGQTLTASREGIADLDGKTKAEAGELGFAYGYQWVRVDSDGTNPVDISGATSVTYVPVKADVGKKVMVKVTFTDDRSNEEELTSAAYPAAGRILNDVPPMLDTATVNGVSLVLTYDRELDGESDPAVGSYTVTVAGAVVTLTGVDAAGRTVTLTLATAVTSGQSVTLDYEVPTMSPVQDSDGTPAGALDGQAVHNVVGDTTAPTLDSAQVDGDVLVLSYSEALDSGSEPAVGQFDVQVTPSGGSASRRTVSTVDVSGSKVTLTLASAVDLDDSVTLSYEKPTLNPLQDVAGNDAAALSGRSVGNAGNNLPMFAHATLTREITENSAANVNVGAVIPAATGGADGATLVYSMEEGTDADSFNFNTTTRQISTKTGVTYDYEQKTSYELTIKVTDGTDNDTVTVTINVKNLPGFSIAPTYERILLSDGRVQFTLTPDTSPAAEVTRVDYTVTQDEAWLAAANLQGVLDHLNDGASTVNNRSFKPDAPARSGNVTFTLQPGDGYELGATTSATVAIVAADPLITVRATQAAVAVDEDGGTVTVTLRAETIAGVPRPRPPDSPPHRTNWVATGDTATGGGADFQDAGGIALFFEDGFTDQGGRWVATRDVQVTVVDDDTWELDETFHVALSREATLHRLVKLANEDGTLCVDLDADEICGATVTILSNDNAAPVFSNSSETREVFENSPAGTHVGAPVTATDADTGDGDELTYSLAVADLASFAIDASTGQITTRAGVDYDFETDPSYSVTVKATDLQDASATVAVTINLIDIDVEVLPAPLSALSLTGIEFNETFEAGVTAYTASVPHAATRTTVSATPETSGATVTILPADASGSVSLPGHQVNLGVGATAITVTVESAGARSVYSVTVTRSGPAVLPPLKPGQELVESFEMVAGAGNAGGVVYGYGAAASGDSLAPTEFEWGGVTYRVTEILVNEDLAHLFVKLDPHPTTEAMAGLSLHIGADTVKDGERISFWILQFSGSTRESNSFSWGFAPAFGPYTNPFGREERAATTVNLRLVTTETTAPILESHTASGYTLTLTYDELLDENSVPARGAFEVNVTSIGGTAQRRDVTAVVVDGVTVTLTLVSPVVPGDTVTVVYTVPGSNPIQDQVGNDAAAINITIELVADQTGVCNRAIQDSGRCDLSTATTLRPGDPFKANVGERNDVDWFRVELVEDKVYRIDMEGAPTGEGTLLDPYLRGMYAVFTGSDVHNYRADGSLDGDGEDIETIWYSLHGDCAAGERNPQTVCELFDEGTYYNDDGGVGYNARLYLRDFPTGAYYVEARGLGPDIGTYTITLTEVTDDAEGPRTLTLSKETSATIDFPDDSDTFEIDLTAVTTYTITLRSQGWDGWSDIDIDSAVYNGTQVATPYNGSTDTYTITPTTTGTHEIKIVGRNWGRHQRYATGDYTITITTNT